MISHSIYLHVYLLNHVDVDGKHNLKDRSIILSTSNLIMIGSVTELKGLTKTERPMVVPTTLFRQDILLLRFLVRNSYGKNIMMSTFGMEFLEWNRGPHRLSDIDIAMG